MEALKKLREETERKRKALSESGVGKVRKHTKQFM